MRRFSCRLSYAVERTVCCLDLTMNNTELKLPPFPMRTSVITVTVVELRAYNRSLYVFCFFFKSNWKTFNR